MRAVVIHRFATMPAVLDVPEPRCPADGVLLDVRASGLCRSDWHAWMGHDPDVRLPHVPGHELAGTVHEIGDEVSGWAVGDRVTVPFVCACGRCEPCRSGQGQVCLDQRQPGFSHWGSFAELVAIERAAVNLVRLPDDLEFDAAAALGCRFSTAYHALHAQAAIGSGQWVAVHGCGGVGLSAVMIAVAHGARVVAIDVSEDALSAARALGAEIVIDGSATAGSTGDGSAAGGSAESRVAARIRAATGGGAHVSLDALGSTSTCLASIESLRTRGVHVQIGLMVGAAARPPVPMDRILARELRVVGSHGMAAHEFAPMMELVRQGRLRPDQLIRRRIGLAELPAELAAMGSAPGHGGVSVVLMPAVDRAGA